MKRLGQVGRSKQVFLVDSSPLRKADPRAKLALCLGISLAVMLPLTRLAIFMVLLMIFLGWAKLLSRAGRQVWRLKWILLILFLFDWWLVSLAHAATVVTRLSLLAGIFVVFFHTTTTTELSLALEKLRIPHRYAFSIRIAFQSIAILEDEWHNILEAQKSRGAWQEKEGLWKAFKHVKDLVSLTVPAVVMATKKAWSITEAAYARGFDSPKRKPYRELTFQQQDWFYVLGISLMLLPLFLWR